MLRSVRSTSLLALTLRVATYSCGGNDGPAAPPAVAKVVIEPPAEVLQVGHALSLTAHAYDAAGVLLDRTVKFATTQVAVATITTAGILEQGIPFAQALPATVRAARQRIRLAGTDSSSHREVH